MIFVTLGTQDKHFPRLLEAVEKLDIDEKIIAQTGSTDFKSNKMEEARIVITHAGVGTIIYGLSIDKTMIVAARLKKYGEHVNDHQLQILDTFSKDGYIIPLREFSELKNKIIEAEKFKPKKFISNNKNFVKLLDNEITKLTKE